MLPPSDVSRALGKLGAELAQSNQPEDRAMIEQRYPAIVLVPLVHMLIPQLQMRHGLGFFPVKPSVTPVFAQKDRQQQKRLARDGGYVLPLWWMNPNVDPVIELAKSLCERCFAGTG